LHELQPLDPSFVSVTYRGGRSSRDRTHDLVVGILKTTTLTPMAHLICVAHTRLELAEILVNFRKAGIENLMALGGDPPTDPDAAEGELAHAIELVELARAIGGFSIGVAAHPAGHPRSPDLDFDRGYLVEKLALADFAVTQFFFEAADYLRLMDDLATRGVDKPIVPGVMPVTNLASIPRMAEMGAAVPAAMAARLEAAADAEVVRQTGVELATELCEKLLAEGAPGLHFYTLNRSRATREIYASLGLPLTG
jgi:methylenetetrahydrofolate reductase (NADPH)